MKLVRYIVIFTLVGFVVGFFTARLFIPVLFGATIARTTITNPWTFASTTKMGSSGTEVARLNTGTCHLNFGNSPAAVSATTSVNVDCQASNMLATAGTAQSALTGITVNDKVVGFLAPTTTPTTNLGIHVDGCSASTTSGYITCKFANWTGANLTPGTTTTSGWQYLVTK